MKSNASSSKESSEKSGFTRMPALIQPVVSSDESSASSNSVPLLMRADNDDSGYESVENKPKENNIANVAEVRKDNRSKRIPRVSCRFSCAIRTEAGRIISVYSTWEVPVDSSQRKL